MCNPFGEMEAEVALARPTQLMPAREDDPVAEGRRTGKVESYWA